MTISIPIEVPDDFFDKIIENIIAKGYVVPDSHGYWIDDEFSGYKKCSVCGRWTAEDDAPFCHCGAKMDGEERSENEL